MVHRLAHPLNDKAGQVHVQPRVCIHARRHMHTLSNNGVELYLLACLNAAVAIDLGARNVRSLRAREGPAPAPCQPPAARRPPPTAAPRGSALHPWGACKPCGRLNRTRKEWASSLSGCGFAGDGWVCRPRWQMMPVRVLGASKDQCSDAHDGGKGGRAARCRNGWACHRCAHCLPRPCG